MRPQQGRLQLCRVLPAAGLSLQVTVCAKHQQPAGHSVCKAPTGLRHATCDMMCHRTSDSLAGPSRVDV
jgi:hypothetical protein